MPELQSLSEVLGVKIPVYTLDTFVQKKMDKVKVMVEVARAHPQCNSGNRNAADRLECFANEFASLKHDSMHSREAWVQFVARFVPAGWEHKLHFDHLLSNFGFDDAFAKTLREQIHVASNPKTGEEEHETLEQFSLRWVGKALNAYRPKGCLTDVVNLVFAMMSRSESGEAKKFSEDDICDTVHEFGRKLTANDLASLWIPTHLLHDAESDDMLCWLLLEHIHRLRGKSLEVMVQLPDSPKISDLAESLKQRPNCRVFRDLGSRNLQAIMDHHSVKV